MIFILEDPIYLKTHTPRQAITMNRPIQKQELASWVKEFNVDLEDFETWLQTFTK